MEEYDMKLRELLNGVPVASCAVDLEMEITGVSYDSRATQPGDLFVAMTGYATDGHKYIATALEKGAAAVLCQNLPEGDGPYIRTADSRRALAVIGANWFGHPAEEMSRSRLLCRMLWATRTPSRPAAWARPTSSRLSPPLSRPR